MRIRNRSVLLTFLAILSLALPLSGAALADKGDSPHEGSNGKGSDQQDSSQAATPSENSSSNQTCDGDPTGNSDTGHGANQGGPYDHNCTTDSEGNPSPSGNGNGDGNATGQPCAGCVGQADDKNPGYGNGKGQMPDGSDHNNGYECDGNNGIGKTNPAHTGCQPSTTSALPKVTPPKVTPPNVTPPNVTPTTIPTTVLGVQYVAGAPPASVGGQALPMTGSQDIPALLLFAASLMGLGLVLTKRNPKGLPSRRS